MSSLLDHIRTLVEAEQGLTEAIEKSLPLLTNNTHQSTSSVILSSSQQTNQAPPTTKHQMRQPNGVFRAPRFQNALAILRERPRQPQKNTSKNTDGTHNPR